MTSPLPAVVVIAHDKPAQLRRLVGAVDPLPVFLHVDATTPAPLHQSMVTGLPERVRLLPRLRAGWGRFAVVAAELSGYRAALAETDAEHVLVATGADHPLVSTQDLVAWLATRAGRSYAEVLELPIAEWGRFGGWDRFLFPQRAWRGRRLLLPLPRRLPAGLRAAGGTQTRILARHHVARVLQVLDERPELLTYFSSCWLPDEVMIPTLLSSPALGFDWAAEGTSAPHPWYVDWGRRPARNPRWLGPDDLDALRAAARRPGVPALFARKFGDDASALTDAVDAFARRP